VLSVGHRMSALLTSSGDMPVRAARARLRRRLNTGRLNERHQVRTEKEAVSELNRELQVRRRCYDRWIADGKLDSIDATDRMERLEAALAICQRAADMTEVQESMAVRLPPPAIPDGPPHVVRVMTEAVKARRIEVGLPV